MAKQVENLRAKLRAESEEATSSKGPAGNLGTIRKLQGGTKRCEIRDQGREKEERK